MKAISKNTNSGEAIIYQTKSGAIELREDVEKDTIWATQAQIAQIFNIDRTVATKHINKILADEEIDKKSNVQKMHFANSDKPVNMYSLDMILSVGYRTNSARAIQFRKWATQTLKPHIADGFTINSSRINQKYEKFLNAVEDIKSLIPKHKEISTSDTLELVKAFAKTWFSLDSYDKSNLPSTGLNKLDLKILADELYSAVADLKQELIQKGETTELFATEKSSGSLEGIVGSVFQSIFGEDAYKSVEEKAAHLLYFIVKNHPFNDGNKRTGAFAFIWFLQKAGMLDKSKLSPEALAVLTILIAESDMKEKGRMIGLILMILR